MDKGTQYFFKNPNQLSQSKSCRTVLATPQQIISSPEMDGYQAVSESPELNGRESFSCDCMVCLAPGQHQLFKFRLEVTFQVVLKDIELDQGLL